MARSNKPIVWSLFAAGGTVAAFLTPILVFVLGLAVPLGLLDEKQLSYQRMSALFAHPLAKVILFGVIVLTLWHAAHRVRTTAHDLGLHNDRINMLVCYAFSAVGTLLSGYFIFAI